MLKIQLLAGPGKGAGAPLLQIALRNFLGDLTMGMLFGTLWILLLVVLRLRKNLARISSPEYSQYLPRKMGKPQNVHFTFLFLSATPAGDGKQPTTNTSMAIL